MRLGLAFGVWMLAGPAVAELASLEACLAQLDGNPAAVRQEAAQWVALGGGTPARLCEGFALRAQGAVETAATRFTELAQDTRAAMEPQQRAFIYTTAGDLWAELGQASLAAQTYAAAAQLAPTAEHLRTLAGAQAVIEDWAGAQETLAKLPQDPADALLRAQVARGLGAYDDALAYLQIVNPTPPELLERARIQAAMGARDAALRDIARAQQLDTERAHLAEIQALLAAF